MTLETAIINIDDERYPAQLKEIADPPRQLYCAGDVSLMNSFCVAVVGSRKNSQYGSWAAKAVSSKLTAAGACVVSGMARGIDTCAHLAALGSGGKTIAVLGTGLDVCYPAANRQLKEQIEKKGLLITEYPPGYPVHKGNFPKRNRIISGLSAATVVAEAGNNSGSLITAQLAAEQGRSVYVIPANINNPNALGGNLLIRDGAMPLMIIDDLIEDLGLEKEACATVIEGLGEDEKRIVRLLMRTSELTSSEISAALKLTPARVNGLLTVLEMKGLVQAALGKIFLAK